MSNLKSSLLVGLSMQFSIVMLPSLVLAQGSLTPPGAPAPTMKTLDQIEARTPISVAPFTISQSGSYYLTRNLNVTNGDAITIAANGVTLDLNGFIISSTANPAGGTGVLLGSAVKNVTILNGHIAGGVIATFAGNAATYAGPGFMNGIFYTGTAPANVRVSGVSVSGCLSHGINLATNSTVIESCTTHTTGSIGLTATTVGRSSAYLCGLSGINAANASDSFAYSTGSGNAISVNVANNCYGYCIGNGNGINANSATNCWGQSEGQVGNNYGVSADTAMNCYGSALHGSGVYADNAINCRGFSTGVGVGLEASTATNCHGSAVSGTGLGAFMAINCWGSSDSGSGLTSSGCAQNCYGRSSSGTGIYVSGTASYCRARADDGNVAMAAAIAIGCTADFGTISSPGKFLGTP